MRLRALQVARGGTGGSRALLAGSGPRPPHPPSPHPPAPSELLPAAPGLAAAPRSLPARSPPAWPRPPPGSPFFPQNRLHPTEQQPPAHPQPAPVSCLAAGGQHPHQYPPQYPPSPPASSPASSILTSILAPGSSAAASGLPRRHPGGNPARLQRPPGPEGSQNLQQGDPIPLCGERGLKGVSEGWKHPSSLYPTHRPWGRILRSPKASPCAGAAPGSRGGDLFTPAADFQSWGSREAAAGGISLVFFFWLLLSILVQNRNIAALRARGQAPRWPGLRCHLLPWGAAASWGALQQGDPPHVPP